MIQTWLAELLPPDVLEKVEGRLQILITPIPSFGKSRIDSFKDRSDLIECNMASVHLVRIRMKETEMWTGYFITNLPNFKYWTPGLTAIFHGRKVDS